MKHFLILVVASLFNSVAFSQDTVNFSRLDTTDAKIFALVEKESAFPGGLDGWRDFLIKNLKYPSKAIKKNIQGMVVVQFIVNKDGSLDNIEAISGPPELYDAAENVIRKSPRWIPAEQSGKPVKAYRKQPIGFRL